MDTLYHFTVLHAENIQEFFITSFWNSLVTHFSISRMTCRISNTPITAISTGCLGWQTGFFSHLWGFALSPKQRSSKGLLHHVCWNGFYLVKKSGIQLTSKLNHLSQGGGFGFTLVPLLEARGRPGCCQGWKPQFLWQSASVAPS